MKLHTRKTVVKPVSKYFYARGLSVVSIIALGVIMVIMSAAPALADDAKVYPGSMCVRRAGSISYVHGAIGNPSSTSWLHLDCPVVRDAGRKATGWVTFIDRHYSKDVSCELRSQFRHKIGPAWTISSDLRVSHGSSDWTQTLEHGSVYYYSGMHTYFSCQIPPRDRGGMSYILSYKVNEM